MKKLSIYFILLSVMAACRSRESNTEEAPIDPVTPVTITNISNESLEEYVELNAISTFQQKWVVKANATGYLQSTNLKLNQYVTANQILCKIKTKEAQSIGNSVSILDTSFKFTGVNNIQANGSGFISQVDHQSGDYVQDGEQLAVITDTKSFVFLLDLPYELRSHLVGKKSLELLLPDGEKLIGIINGNLPTMDAISQTQSIVLNVHPRHAIPENLIAKVRIAKSSRANTNSLPKSCILTDETQSDFWVMKLINDSVAAKVMIKKGIEADDKIEILDPVFSPDDRILFSGNYGLADTAKVKIINE